MFSLERLGHRCIAKNKKQETESVSRFPFSVSRQRQETRNKKQETDPFLVSRFSFSGIIQKTENKKQETRNKKQETRNKKPTFEKLADSLGRPRDPIGQGAVIRISFLSISTYLWGPFGIPFSRLLTTFLERLFHHFPKHSRDPI
jgi:hypothetical protein